MVTSIGMDYYRMLTRHLLPNQHIVSPKLGLWLFYIYFLYQFIFTSHLIIATLCCTHRIKSRQYQKHLARKE